MAPTPPKQAPSANAYYSGAPAGTTPSALPSQPSDSLPEIFGRYRVLKLLGKGGMGTVYLAQDTHLDRQVALKIPHFQPDDATLPERFVREARAAARIHHPLLCPVYDLGQVNGVHYLTMAYLEGRLLSELVRAGHLPPLRAADLIRQLALAVAEAHAHGVIHRDLKPGNIMVNKRGEPVIMDFGLAYRADTTDARLTQPGQVLGTPAYMPPEQVTGQAQAIGPGCDIYSLGVIFYELLAGQLPFQGQFAEVLAQIMLGEPRPPSAYRPDLSPRLEKVCLKAMAKKVEDRYASMVEMAAALTDCLPARPGRAAGPARTTAWTGRRRLAAVAGIVLLSLTNFLGGFLLRPPPPPQGPARASAEAPGGEADR